MCGIFGTISLDGTGSIVNAAAAIERLRHRGPDDVGVWQNAIRTVALAQRRLSLVSLDNGHQPIFNEDQSIVAVVNGEFYGHREIRRQLEAEGHRFSLDSDSEIVVHLYERYGEDFVRHLRGEFAILIWDHRRAKLIAVRDRFGVKPLVYTRADDNCTFASEAKALLPDMPEVSWDVEAFLFAANLQYLPTDRTLFAGVQILPPGHFAIVDGSGFQLVKYWDLDYPEASIASEDVQPADRQEAIEETRRLLKSAVLERLDADVPVCFHLSGGLDSSAALGIASKEVAAGQHAFTICFESQDYDERRVAKETAAFCEAELHLVELSEQQLIDSIHASAMASEGLAINGHLPAKYLLNQRIEAAGFKAAITGEGADETFLGYAHLQLDWWSSQSVEFRHNLVRSTNQTSLGMMLPHGESLSLRKVDEQLGFVPTFLAAKATLGYRLHSILDEDVLQASCARDAYAELIGNALRSGQLQGRSPIHQSAWLWSKLALAGYILKTLGDGTEMASSIEGRLPYLDHHLFEYVRRQSVHQLIRGQTGKSLLREAVKPFVTRQVYRRQKHPFDAPPLLINQSGSINEFLRDQIESDSFRRLPFFDYSRVKKLVEKIPEMDLKTRQIWDPVFMMISSAVGIQELISQTARVEV